MKIKKKIKRKKLHAIAERGKSRLDVIHSAKKDDNPSSNYSPLESCKLHHIKDN